ncbi:MAG: pyruvate kinase [Chloroflexota bacterium]
MPQASYLHHRTKIIATIGPATSSAGTIERLIRAGMNVSRHNLSHGTPDEHARHIQTVRRLAQRLKITVAVLMDLPGPKYRTGELSDGSVTLKKGSQLVLTTRLVPGDATAVSVNLPSLPRDVRAGDTVLLDDGAMQLRVQSTSGTEVTCRVIVGGRLIPERGVVVPGRNISAPFITDLLREQLAFAARQQPDYLALSFVGSAGDVEETRALLPPAIAGVPLIAKIERGQAVAHFDRILGASDGIMVARGDLGVDIPLEKVPLVQKEIIRQCNRAGKPVITATQMLESMVSAARPTRAEVTDVANAIFDGTDAIMLSAETSVGKYPIPSVRMMARIARQTERKLPYDHLLAERAAELGTETDELISYDACHTAHRLGAAAIVAFTQSGSTARRVAKYRPRVPILAITSSQKVCQGLMLFWGVNAVPIAPQSSVADLFATGARLAKEMGLAKSGDLVVITGGVPVGTAGTTNLLKVEQVS